MVAKKTHTIDAEVTIKFVIPDICESDYNDDEDMCFEDMVREKIDWEGLYSFVDEDEESFSVVEVKKIQ